MFHHNFYKLKIVQSELELYSLIKKLKASKHRFFDTETTGLRVRHPGIVDIVGWTFAMDDTVDETVYYIPVGHEFEGEYLMGRIDLDKLKLKARDFPHFKEEILKGNWKNLDSDRVTNALKDALYDQNGIWIAHNIMYDLHVIANCGVDVERMVKCGNYFDTQVAFHTIDEEAEKKLESIIKQRYHIVKTDFSDVVATVTGDEKKQMGMKANNKASFQHVQIPIGAYYSGEDVWFMKQLFPESIEEMEEDESLKLFYRLRMPFLMVLWRMERRGVNVDLHKLAIMTKKAEEKLEDLKYQIYEICGIEFNIGSGQQVGEILFGHKKKLVDKVKGGYKESYNEKLVINHFGFPVQALTEGGANKDKNLKNPKTDAATLQELLEINWSKKLDVSESHFRKGKRVVKLLLIFARLEKLYSSFMVGLKENMYADGKVHPSFNICGTDSWRLSCDSPNLQQLPRPLEKPKPPKDNDPAYKVKYQEYQDAKLEYDIWIQFEIRELFIPDNEDQCIIAGDWSNLEKRISAHFTKDPNLIRLFNEKLDGHGLIATIIFPELADVHPNLVKKIHPDLRQIAKGVGFAMDYGGTSFAVSRNLKIDKETAQQYIDRYFAGFEGLATWAVSQKQFGRKYGYVLTILGHKRHLNGMEGGIRSENIKIRSYYERLCLNAPIQGSAADIAIRAQLLVDKDVILRALGVEMRIQVHDELVFVAPKKYKFLAMQRIKYLMENCLPQQLVVPITCEVDYGSCYAEAK